MGNQQVKEIDKEEQKLDKEEKQNTSFRASGGRSDDFEHEPPGKHHQNDRQQQQQQTQKDAPGFRSPKSSSASIAGSTTRRRSTTINIQNFLMNRSSSRSLNIFNEVERRQEENVFILSDNVKTRNDALLVGRELLGPSSYKINEEEQDDEISSTSSSTTKPIPTKIITKTFCQKNLAKSWA